MSKTYEFAKNDNDTKKHSGPIIETTWRKSKDGRFCIHKTIITDIKPWSYVEKVAEGDDD